MIAEVVAEMMAQEGGRATLEGISRVSTLEEAVLKAADASGPGDVVLLSPGGTSYDAFQDFAERGARFKELVRAL